MTAAPALEQAQDLLEEWVATWWPPAPTEAWLRFLYDTEGRVEIIGVLTPD